MCPRGVNRILGRIIQFKFKLISYYTKFTIIDIIWTTLALKSPSTKSHICSPARGDTQLRSSIQLTLLDPAILLLIFSG